MRPIFVRGAETSPRLLLVACLCVASGAASSGHAPAPLPRGSRSLPVGKWRVEFANGVVETCEVRKDGTVSVVEPRRNSPGRAKAVGGAVVIRCDDDRTERWTWKDSRLVVEHWFPASRYPDGSPVLGVARRER